MTVSAPRSQTEYADNRGRKVLSDCDKELRVAVLLMPGFTRLRNERSSDHPYGPRITDDKRQFTTQWDRQTPKKARARIAVGPVLPCLKLKGEASEAQGPGTLAPNVKRSNSMLSGHRFSGSSQL